MIKERKTKNTKLHKISRGIISCAECGNPAGNVHDGVIGYKITYACRCGSCGYIEVNTKEIREDGTKYAVLEDNHLFCPACNKELMSVNFSGIRNIAVRIRCGCGTLCEGYEQRKKSRLKEYL